MGSRTGALVLAAAAALTIAATPAAAAPTRDGWGFAIADDDWDWDNPGHLPSLEDGFADLEPKAFRFQMIWNAAELPWHMDRARAMIAHARAQGVEQIVVTFKKSVGQDVDPTYGAQPPAEGYALRVGEVVRQLADDVDVWGPANEPNRGETWLPRVAGAQLLAQYYARLQEAVATWDPSAQITSPDFVDRSDLGTIGAYVNAYENAGGGWGDHVAWHPYSGAQNETTQTTLDLIALAPPGADVWVTEVGAFARDQRGIEASETTQNDKVWWLASSLAALPQVTRIHYYHMRGSPTASWDTGLMEVDGSRRLAWHTWCAFAHGDVAEPACQPVTPRSTPLPPSPGPPTPSPAAPAAASANTPPPAPVCPSPGCPVTFPAPPPDRTAPTATIDRLPRRLAFDAFADGFALRVRTNEPAALRFELLVKPHGTRGRLVVVARKTFATAGGARRVRLRPRRAKLPAARRLAVRVRVSATDPAGNRSAATERLLVTGR